MCSEGSGGHLGRVDVRCSPRGPVVLVAVQLGRTAHLQLQCSLSLEIIRDLCSRTKYKKTKNKKLQLSSSGSFGLLYISGLQNVFVI